MTGLARVMERHAQALEYDLMTRTGRTLGEYMEMGVPGKVALVSFVRYLPPDSATGREANPNDEARAWGTTFKTNAILADLYDVFCAANAKKGRRPKPYPRPNSERRTLGRGAIRIRDFEAWWNGS